MQRTRLEVLRDVVDDLRAMRRKGASAAELVDHLGIACGGDPMSKTDYLRAAFQVQWVNLFYLPVDSQYRFIPERLNASIDPQIDAAAPEWEAAEPYPDLYRRRDREVFRSLAEETGNVFFVCSTNPQSTKYVSRAGYRPCPWYVQGTVRASSPNAGLIAWDPSAGDGLLRDMGLYVGPAEDGFVIRDAAGAAFFPAYELHGVYDGKTGANAWTGRSGERLRAQLNRGFGMDLIQCGPRDASERRRALPASDPQFAPKLPVLAFNPSGSTEVDFDRDSLQKSYAYHHIDWSAYYG